MKPKTPQDRAVAAIIGIHYGGAQAARMLGVTSRSIRRYIAEASDETTEVSAAVRVLVGGGGLSEGMSLGDWIFERVKTFSGILESKLRTVDPNTDAGVQALEIGRQHVRDLLEHAQTRTYISALFGLHGEQQIAYADEQPDSAPRSVGAPDGRDEAPGRRYPKTENPEVG